MKTETIYKRSSTGKIVTAYYNLEKNDDGEVFYQAITGQIDGKKTTSKPKFIKGKNIGKSNETTPWTQALSELKSKIKKKLEAGYKHDLKEALEDLVLGPELATKFEDRKRSIDWDNAYASPKIDGLRCMSDNQNSKTRTGKLFKTIPFIQDSLKYLHDGVILDGELYTDKFPFEELVGILRREKNTIEELQLVKNHVKFYVFDVIDLDNLDLPFTERNKNMQEYRNEFVEIVPQVKVVNEEELMTLHDHWVKLGYEGAMIRNGKAEYGLNKRTKNIQKVKVFDDAEFKIIGYEEGEGNFAGCVIWKCATESGKTFTCSPKGTREMKMEWLKNADKYITKMLTVKYFGLLESGKPRFPIGISIRDYD